MTRLALLTACLALGAAPAVAGGFTAPAVEPVVETPAPAAAPAPGGWSGAYVGGTLGYAFRGDDRVGVRTFEDGVRTDTIEGGPNLRLKGMNYGLRVGYLARLDNLVIGPELSFESGDIAADDSETNEVTGGVATTTARSEVKSIAALKLKAGFALNEQTLVYGLLGAAQGKFRYDLRNVETGDEPSDFSLGADYRANGYVVGAGVERRLTDRLSATAEFNYANFGRTDVVLVQQGENRVETTATPAHSNVKLGLNFRF